MKLLKRLGVAAVAASMAMAAASAQASVFDFIDMADNTVGEKGFAVLSLGGILDITGYATNDDDSQQFAYLDQGNAGLGSCKDITAAKQCKPSSDDNVTSFEGLKLTALTDLVISSIWFNNNHDEGFGAGDKINVGSDVWSTGVLSKSNPYGYADDSQYTTDILLAAGEFINISFNNEQFYISALDVSAVSEPSVLALIGMGLFGLGLVARKKA